MSFGIVTALTEKEKNSLFNLYIEKIVKLLQIQFIGPIYKFHIS